MSWNDVSRVVADSVPVELSECRCQVVHVDVRDCRFFAERRRRLLEGEDMGPVVAGPVLAPSARGKR